MVVIDTWNNWNFLIGASIGWMTFPVYGIIREYFSKSKDRAYISSLWFQLKYYLIFFVIFLLGRIFCS